MERGESNECRVYNRARKISIMAVLCSSPLTIFLEENGVNSTFKTYREAEWTQIYATDKTRFISKDTHRSKLKVKKHVNTGQKIAEVATIRWDTLVLQQDKWIFHQ